MVPPAAAAGGNTLPYSDTLGEPCTKPSHGPPASASASTAPSPASASPPPAASMCGVTAPSLAATGKPPKIVPSAPGCASALQPPVGQEQHEKESSLSHGYSLGTQS